MKLILCEVCGCIINEECDDSDEVIKVYEICEDCDDDLKHENNEGELI